MKWISIVGANYGENIVRVLGVYIDGFGWVGLWNVK